MEYNVGLRAANLDSGPDFIAEVAVISDDVNDLTLPRVTIEPVSTPISESVGSGVVQFRLRASTTPASSDTIMVPVVITQEGNFLNTTDLSRDVSVTIGEETNTFDVAISNDDFDEPNGAIIATIQPDTTGLLYAIAGDNKTQVAVEDDDEPLNVSITRTGSTTERTATVEEGDAPSENVSLSYDVTLSRAPAETVTVTYTVGLGSDSAKLNEDYTVRDIPATGTLMFQATDPLTKMIVIDITEDSINEADESFTITITSTSTGVTIPTGGGRATGTIENDDLVLPVINIADAEGYEDNGTIDGTITFTLSLEDTAGVAVAAGRDIMVDFVTSNPTGRAAAEIDDYTAVNRTGNMKVTISKGSMSEDVEVRTTMDSTPEPDEKFTVTLSDPDFATLSGNGTAIGTILSDDDPVFLIDNGRGEEGDNINFTVSLTRPMDNLTTYTVDYGTTDGAAASKGVDFNDPTSVGGKPLMFTGNRKSHIISVPTIERPGYQGNRTFTISLRNPSGSVPIIGGSATGTIVEDDPRPPELTIAAVNAEVVEADLAKASFTITATEQPPANFEFRYQVEQEGDFLATTPAVPAVPQRNNSLTFTASGAVYTTTFEDFAIENDEIGEATGSVTVKLLAKDVSSGDYTLGQDVMATVSILDDDAPELSIANGTAVVEGTDTNASFEVTSKVNVTEMLRVLYVPNDGAGDFLGKNMDGENIAGNDQVAMLNFNGGTTATLLVKIDDDEVVEEDGFIQVMLITDDADPINYTVSGATEAGKPDNLGSVAVSDDDSLATSPTITLASEYLPTGATTATYYVVADSAPAKALEIVLEFNYAHVDNSIQGSPVTTYAFTEWSKANVKISAGETFGTFKQITTFPIRITTTTPPFVSFVQAPLTVRLVDGTNYNLGNPNTSGLPTMTATATNPLITISRIGDQNVVESSELKFRLTASPIPATNVPVTVHVTQTGDFIAEDLNSDNILVKTVSIQSTGSSIGRGEFIVDLDDDDVADPSIGSITATIQSGSNYVISTYTQTATAAIHDNDTLPVLSIADSAQISEGEGPLSFTVTANVPQATNLEVQYLIETGAGEDFIWANSPLNFDQLAFTSAGGGADFIDTIDVRLIDDELDEANGTVSVTLIPDTTFPFSYAVDATAKRGSASVTDDDDPPVLTIADAEGMEGSVIEFIPTLANQSGRDVVVRYSTSAGEEFPADSADYTDKSDRITIRKGELNPIKEDGTPQPIEISTAADTDPEPDETFTLTFEADFADTSADNKAIGTILSDDDRVIGRNI